MKPDIEEHNPSRRHDAPLTSDPDILEWRRAMLGPKITKSTNYVCEVLDIDGSVETQDGMYKPLLYHASRTLLIGPRSQRVQAMSEGASMVVEKLLERDPQNHLAPRLREASAKKTLLHLSLQTHVEIVRETFMYTRKKGDMIIAVNSDYYLIRPLRRQDRGV